MSVETIEMYQNATKTIAGNIAGKDAPGEKKKEFVINTTSGGSTVSKIRATNDIQGDIESTNVKTDLAINGAGLFVVADALSGAVKYTRRGDFRPDQLSYWENGEGQRLQGWKYDAQGNLPQGLSLLSSLETMNFASAKAAPKPTTVLSLSMNLDAGQEALRGSGISAALSNSGKNAGKGIDNIIFPERISNASIELGATFTFKSSDGSLTKTVKFGGIVIAKAPGNDAFSQIYGSNSPSRSFTFTSPALLPTQLDTGHVLNIQVGGQIYAFTATQGAENATNKTFNTINGLAAAINKISSLKAEVDSQGRLHIAPTKANDAVIFTDGNGGNIKEALGLVDLAAATAGTTRFNSFGTLRDAINSDQTTYSLKSTVDGKNLQITALLSTSTLDVTSSSLGLHPIRSTTYNPTGDAIGRATVFIEAHSHTLVAGDLVNITGQGTLPDGIYSVGDINQNGFFVSLIQDNAQFPAAAAAVTTLLGANTATWQKVGGESFPIRGGQITASTTGAGQQALTITAAAHGYAVDDVIYVEGGTFYQGGNNITLPSGYYRVATVPSANTFTFGATASLVGAQAAGYDGDTFNFRKIGTTAAGALPLAVTGTFNTRVFSTNAVGTNTVNYFIGTDHPYNVGDTITFTGLDPAGLVLAGVTIVNNLPYKILTINAAGYITFELDAAGGVSTGAANSVYGAPAAGVTPLTLRVDNSSQLMQYLNLDPNTTHYDKTYDPNDVDKNLSEGVNGTSHFPSSLTYSVPLTIYDSLGSPYTLMLCFAKLQSNEWAVELVAQKNTNGEFEVTNLAKDNGLIKSGTIKFDSDGKLQSTPGFEDVIPITRNNNSSPSNITLDWANLLSDITSGSVSQTRNPNNIEIVQNDGRAAGSLTKIEVSSNGDVMGTFSSGNVEKLYKVALATFSNVNGLTPSSNGTFEASRESGDVLLKGAGSGGTGEILASSIEKSNVNFIEELLQAQSYADAMRANMKILAMQNENTKTVLNELRN